jgi:uncharacterized protein GlcG (DUF336 family)
MTMQRSALVLAAASAAAALALTGCSTAGTTGGTTAPAAAGSTQPVAVEPAAAVRPAAAVEPAANRGPQPAAEAGSVPAENTVQQRRVSVQASLDAVAAAMEQCQADNLPFVTVALVDRFGTVQALLRGDNAGEHTIEAAKQKAYTAAAFGAPTSELAKRVTGNGPGIDDLPGTLFLAGGVPLKVDGASIAGIGVGGAPDGARDEACAAAGAAAIAQAIQ